MKYYSETLNKLFDSEAALNEAESAQKKADAEKAAAEEKKNSERAAAAKRVEEAMKAASEATEKYHKELADFCDKYGTFHYSFKANNAEDRLTLPSLVDSFFSFL